MSHEVFVDAEAWIAICDARDRYHRQASEFYRHLLTARRTLVTTNLVITESYIVIRRAGGLKAALGFLDAMRPSARLLRICSDDALEREAEQILRSYPDHAFSLTDAVSFAVMRRRGITEAFAFDRHFLVAGFSLVPGV